MLEIRRNARGNKTYLHRCSMDAVPRPSLADRQLTFRFALPACAAAAREADGNGITLDFPFAAGHA